MRTFDPSRPDFAPYGFTCELWVPRPMPRANRHNEIEINFLRTGSLTYLLGGRRATMYGGRLAAFWAAIPHQVIAHEGDELYYVATIPLAWFLQAGIPAEAVQRLLKGEVVAEPDERRAALDAQLFQQWLSDLERPGEDTRRIVLLEIEARVLRLAHAAPKRTGDARRLPDTGTSKLEQMATFIAQRYTQRLTVDDIAKAVGLHPSYAMTLFRRAFGSTLLEYLTQLRVSHAQRLLATTDKKIVDVALSSGFGSVSRFNAAFQVVAGTAPREYREKHRIRAG